MALRAQVVKTFSDDIGGVVATAETVHGWIAGEAAKQMALASYNLPDNATVVEIGVFMGRSTVLLGAPRRLKGSGKVHSIDPFDCSGDAHSAAHYRNELVMTGQSSVEQAFKKNVSQVKLDDWVQVHKGTSSAVASTWTSPIDLLLLDGDQSPQGAREAFDSWFPFLKKGGILVLSNTGDRAYSGGHDGNRRLSVEAVIPPQFQSIRQVGYFRFAEKA